MLFIDTREKPEAIRKITEYFDTHRVKYVRTKLYIGDYQYLENPQLVIDRKQNIAELATNCCTKDRVRFKKELERARDAGVTVVILVEQNRYKSIDKTIEVNKISDLILWESKYGTIRGEQVFRVLNGWLFKYPLRIEFCDKRSTGRRIKEILDEGLYDVKR